MALSIEHRLLAIRLKFLQGDLTVTTQLVTEFEPGFALSNGKKVKIVKNQNSFEWAN